MTKAQLFFKNLPLILLVAAIALSPSYFAGRINEGRIIEIRAEDILLVFLGLGWIIYVLVSGKTNIRKPPLGSVPSGSIKAVGP